MTRGKVLTEPRTRTSEERALFDEGALSVVCLWIILLFMIWMSRAPVGTLKVAAYGVVGVCVSYFLVRFIDPTLTFRAVCVMYGMCAGLVGTVLLAQ